MITKKHIYYILGGAACAAIGIYIGSKWLVRRQDIQKEEIEGNTEVETVLGDDNIIPDFDEYVNKDVPGTNHFSIDEYACHDGTAVPEDMYGNVQTLMEQMEIARAEFGNKPIHINSGYRTPAYNKKVGGVGNSQHLLAKANDFTVPGFTPSQVKQKMEQLIAAGKILPGGLGLYPTFVHYDIRGTNTRWSG